MNPVTINEQIFYIIFVNRKVYNKYSIVVQSVVQFVTTRSLSLKERLLPDRIYIYIYIYVAYHLRFTFESSSNKLCRSYIEHIYIYIYI